MFIEYFAYEQLNIVSLRTSKNGNILQKFLKY